MCLVRSVSAVWAMAITCGHASTLLLALILLPLPRTSSYWTALGETRRPLYLHRVLGYLGILAISAHFFCVQAAWALDGSWVANAIQYVRTNPKTPWPWVIPMMEVLFILSWAAVWWLSVYPRARRINSP